MARGRDQSDQNNPARKSLTLGTQLVAQHPLFAELWSRTRLLTGDASACPADGWAIVTARGEIHVSGRRAEPEEWAYVLAHCLLHLGFDHFKVHENEQLWNAACDCVVAQFLNGLKLGRPPAELRMPDSPPTSDVEALYRIFVRDGVPRQFAGIGTGGAVVDMWRQEVSSWYGPDWWSKPLQEGILLAVSESIRVASGAQSGLGGSQGPSNAALARSWFISSYPLLGALAESFRLIEDVEICRADDITVAAVDAVGRVILVNPAANLSLEAAKFVIAHEILHVGLCHHSRRCGRDPFLWNVACDYVINAWLLEMHIGVMPPFGGLHDPELKGLSAEAVYDRLTGDLRRYRKLATLRGTGSVDMIERTPQWWSHGEGVGLDEFYRSCLARGLVYHNQQLRGLLPAGLLEEIRAIQQPPIPWDVQLAQWFDAHFSPLERRRSYARASRRQSVTPEIPRPAWHVPEEATLPRTFGVVLDTSGSMEPRVLGMALGAIASFAASREVPRARVVFCDADAYDAGYMAPEQIADRVTIRGRGGTVLRPAITLLEEASDFPPEGPILIVTDGQCDRIEVKREHAFLMPEGARLPFPARGPVFYMRDR